MVNQVVQQLMRTAPRGQPLDVEMLRRMDISPSQASLLARAGWLQRLSRGAYLLAGDTPTTDGIIAF
ncbi:AbiEi antitoxin N-terminal domain-containing protein [Chromobacterium haemolyticum]|uniref:AbiEi antitoxin N-terminal domain-containing protein n=2 Tax=Chromobacterium TaxID=535 RepID=UPI0037C15B0F